MENRKEVLTLEIQSATCPKTVLHVDAFRKTRNGRPDCKMVVTSSHVCQSYKRWANIGLPTTVEEYTYPLLIVLDRRDPAEKKIWIVDPTNAHFYETVENPAVDGIWMDVADEFLNKINYAFKCTCPWGKCTCSENWSIHFFRCKEIKVHGMDYSKTVLCLAKRRVFNTMVVGYMNQLPSGKWPSTQTKDELRSVTFFGMDEDEFKAVLKDVAVTLEKSGATLEELEARRNKPAESVDPFEPVSEVHCELCGRDEGRVAGELLKRCGRCKKIQYCSDECQKKDWPRHKKTCIPPPVDLGNQILLMPTMHVDPETNELYFMEATEKPTLIKKQPKFWQ